MNEENNRKILLQFQKSLYPFIFNSNYFWDLAISNRDADPAIFVFIMLFATDNLHWEQNEFMNTVAHLFEVRTHCADPKVCLPPLPAKTESFLKIVNKEYIKALSRFYSAPLLSLQIASDRPLHYIKSFLYTFDVPKNSYILDFFTHGSSVRLTNENRIGQGEHWQALFNIDQLLKSLMTLLENYYGEKDERLKKLKVIYKAFELKFLSIFA